MNPLRIINLALKMSGVLGVGQTALAEDVNDAFDMLNMMVALWCRKRWLIYHLVDVACRMTGAQSYTVGLNGDFNVTRPDDIEAAYVRLLNRGTGNASGLVDIPLNIIEAREDYSKIALKSLVSFPGAVFYDSDYPLGRLYPWPIPNSTYEIHIIVKETLNKFPDLQTEINLPPEYQEALIWNLATRLRPMYGLPPDPSLIVYAKTGLSTIRGANSQIPDLQLPGGLSRSGSGNWASHGVGGVREGTFVLDQTGLT